MRILVVEDEYSLSELISDRLKKEKYDVDVCLDGEEGLYNALLDVYDLIILDIMLPKVNGLDILRKIKDKDIKSKVIMLTAKGELEDKLLGFSEGANDYVSKLSNAVKGNSNIDFNGYKLYVNGEAIN